MKLRLPAARVNASLTQAEMAQKMGVHISTVSKWEKGKANMTAQQLKRFCEITGVSMGDILLPSVSGENRKSREKTDDQ